MASPQKRQLLRELENAMAKEAMLKQQHTDMIRTVARSPNKSRAPPAPAPRREDKTSKAKVGAPLPRSFRTRESTIPAVHAPPPAAPSPQSISPTGSQDTVGREIDEAIAKSVANMLQTPPVRGPRIVPIPAAGTTGDVSPLSPTFFTSKRRNMHCELDEPGRGVPYPRAQSGRHRQGFFSRLFSCFAPPSPYSPPMGTPLPRPVSAKVTPPTLQLRSEMEPLRQSLATLKPGLLSGAIGDYDQDMEPCVFDDPYMMRRSLTRSIAAAVASDPPTPRFGGVAGAGMRHSDYNEGEAPQLDSEDSFESLTAELSEGGNTPEVLRPRRRQQEQQPPSQLPMPSKEDVAAAQEHASALRHALIKAVSSSSEIPLPGQQQQQHHHHQQQHLPGPVKTTQVSVAALMGQSTQSMMPQQDERVGRGRERRSDASRSSSAQRQQQAPVAGSRTASRSPEKRTYATMHASQASRPGNSRSAVPFSAPVSPLKETRRGRQEGETVVPQKPRVAAVSAPASRCVSPLRQPSIQPRMTKASAARSQATQRLLQSRKQRELTQLSAASAAAKLAGRGGGGNASRPRGSGNRAGATNASTHSGFVLPPAGGGGGGGGGVSAAHSEASYHNNNYSNTNGNTNAREGGIPSSGGSSPRFADMLDRLAMGRSVDMELVQAAKKPSGSHLSLTNDNAGDINGGRASAADITNRGSCVLPSAPVSRRNSRESGQEGGRVVQQVNTVYHAGIDTSDGPSPLLASQRMVSIHEVARSRPGSAASVEYDGNGGGSGGGGRVDIDVDASSNTLLQQLLGMERSLSLRDLDALKQAIRRDADHLG